MSKKEIGKLVVKFSNEELEALLRALQKQYLMSKAERLQQSIVPNKLITKEIAEETRIVRKQRYESR